MLNPIKLPSKFQIGDFCGLKFREEDSAIGAQVTKISFTKSKVLYDIEIGVGDGMVTRLHSIDSVFITDLS